MKWISLRAAAERGLWRYVDVYIGCEKRDEREVTLPLCTTIAYISPKNS